MNKIFPDSLSDRLKRIKLVAFDVDGVMTDGRIIYDDNGVESKFFSVKDGHGIRLLMKAGLQIAIITGRKSRVVEKRAENLGVKLVFQGAGNKVEVFEKLLNDLGLTDAEAAFAGDDLIDLRVMKRAGLALAPADASEDVKLIADYVCVNKGGRGAVREMAELILKGLDLWEDVTAIYR